MKQKSRSNSERIQNWLWYNNVFLCGLYFYVFCPSVWGLQSILDVCQAYAELRGVNLNFNKTVCMTFKAKIAKSTVTPLQTLGGQNVKSVTHYKYPWVVFKGAARGGAEGTQAPSLAIRILMFIFLVIHQHCKSRSGVLQNVLRQYHKA